MDWQEKQKEICKKYKSQYVAMQQGEKIAFIGENCKDRPLYGARMNAVDDHGEEFLRWCVWAGNLEEEVEDEEIDQEEDMMELKEVEEKMPEIMPFLALEEDFNFFIDEEGEVDIWRDK